MATKTKRHHLKPRNPTDYDSRVEGRRETQVPPDDHTLNESVVPVNLVRPRWDEAPLVFRPFPCPDYKNPETVLQPGRTAPEPESYTHWHLKVPCAYYIGFQDCVRHTFCLYHPKDKEAKAKSPYRMFYRACKNAFDNGKFGRGMSWRGDWNKFMKGGKGKGAVIDKPKYVYFMLGCVLQNGERNYMERDREKPYGLGQNDELCVIQLKGSAGESMVRMMDQRKDEFEGDEEQDFSVGFVWGDPVGKFLPKKRKLAGGTWVEVFNPFKNKITGDHSSFSGKLKDQQGYEVALYRKYELDGVEYPASLGTHDVDWLFQHLQFLGRDKVTHEEGLIHVAPFEQQALWIAQAYASVPQLVAWAFKVEGEEYMTEEVKAVLSAKVTSVVPQDEDEDEEETPRGKKARKDPTVKGGKKKRAAEEEDEDEEDEEPAPKKGGKKAAASKKPAASAKGKKGSKDDDYFGEGGTATSMKAAKATPARKTPDKAAPKPPASKGGAAKRKK
jgi:hypothetical protein